MAKYRVTYGFIKTGEGPEGLHGVGAIVELDELKGDAIVESGVAEKVVEAPKPATKVEPKK